MSKYHLIYAPRVLEKISDIENYISNVLAAPDTAKNRVTEIFNELAKLKIMPESYPSADDKVGKRISENSETKFTLIVSSKYLVFFFIDGMTVYVSHLIPSETDYMSLFV